MKRLVIEVDEELHKKIKTEAFRNEKSMKQYVLEIIEKDMETKKEQTQ